MKVLVINASANKERSTTLKLTNAFLEGLGNEATEIEYVTTIGLHINPCRACYACWFNPNRSLELCYYKMLVKYANMCHYVTYPRLF